MGTAIKKVVIVGGGTAGWITANHLARAFKSSHDVDGVSVVLLESPTIPTVGVGEGTVPAIRKTLQYFGISEVDLIRECDATFKQSVKFVDWVNSPVVGKGDYYHHLFDYPAIQMTDPTYSWLAGEAGLASYADTVSVQGRFCDQGLAPKMITQAEYVGVSSYAYHLDASKFSALLSRNAVDKLGVTHLKANVIGVEKNADGSIGCVLTDALGGVAADLFVDCTGFSSLLLGEEMRVPFVDKGGVLLTDTAIVAQVPYKNEHDPIPSCTISTAKSSGWVWDIGLSQRRGAGYVYSSSHQTDDAARLEFQKYLGREVDVRKIPMKVGYREKFWVSNCVAIGLSQGFVEPLEATGLLMFDATAKMLADLLPRERSAMDRAAKQFNANTLYAWERVVDFIKLHYCISKRDDSDFWYDSRDKGSIPDSLSGMLDTWRSRAPNSYDFSSSLSIFGLENFLYVLYGMRFETGSGSLLAKDVCDGRAVESYRAMQGRAEHAMTKLLPNRELINKIHLYGLQKI